MLTRLLAAVLFLALVGAASVACVPQTPFDPLAVRLGESGAIEILDTECDMQAVTRVEVISPDADTVVGENDPRLWRIDFESPSTARTYVVGQVPSGGKEVVEWRDPGPDQRLFAQIITDGGMTFGAGFGLDDLADGRVRYHLKNMTHEEFLEESKC
ncbi:hypothetical protein ADK67_41715 [Saccharothrix sp. NRRL B-16348]|uniref:hypothetical protein n=1 Tax=Saccharothrix sp. NRRL B-16348 TaxID=1415542 RepID=UPI0006ADC025|nr:hypothetical protein [Saccharothrix sp. NRRL B-16348]KOX15315.1 hypothetical protein ADK67_41715 [Saccharothrix sp. NRRL B-16348]